MSRTTFATFSRSFITFGTEVDAQFAADVQRRTITGLMVPWNQSAHTQGKRWRFARGGIKWGHLNRIKLLRDHDNASALGKCIDIQDTERGLVGTFRISEGPRGDEALALAADEVLDGLSIGVEWREQDYGPDPQDPGGYLVFQSALRECSLTAMPAFDDSRLTSVRASDRGEQMNECERCGAQLVPGQAHTCPTEQPAGQQPNSQPATQPEPQQTASGTVTPAPSGPAVPEQAPTSPAPQEATFSAADVARLLAAVSQHPGATPGIVPLQQPAQEPRPTVNPTAQALPQAAVFVNESLPYRFHYQPRSGNRPGGRHIFASDAQYDFSTDLFSVINRRDADGSAEKRVNGLIRAAFDVDTTDLAGVMPKKQRPDLWQPQMDYAMPLWDMINSGDTDGSPFELPKYNSSSGLVTAAVEGVEPAPGALTVTTQTITPTQLWGKVELTRQAVRRGGNPQTSGIIWDQMLREYYEDREAAVATFLNTLTAATDITITGLPASPTNDSYQASAASLEAALASLQFVRGGNRFTAFAVHEALYKVLAAVTDDGGRPLYPMMSPMNANGTTAPLYRTMDIGGTLAVPAWALGAAGGNASVNSWLFDPSKVRGWASAPERLEWNFGATVQTANIPQLAEVTIGIYGDIALGNVDINGVRQVIFDQNTAA